MGTFMAKPTQPSVFIGVGEETLQEKTTSDSSNQEELVCLQTALLIPAQIWSFVSSTLLFHQLLSGKPFWPDIIQSFAYAALKEQPLKNIISIREPPVFRSSP